MNKLVKVTYNAETLETVINVDGQSFDTSRISGKEIADWAYPFMVRKVRWDGFYDEMVAALGGEKAFDLVFEGSDEALAELKEAWEDAPVNVVSGEQGNIVTIMYDADSLTTEITVNGQPFDTARINGKEIEDWVYPFMMRKVKWNGIFDELKSVLGTDEYDIQFSGSRAAMKVLMEDCPETVTISYQKSNKPATATGVSGKAPQSRKDSSEPKADDEEALYQKGKEFYDKKDYKNAISYYKQAAEMGSQDAMFSLGGCYFDGNGVEEDWDEAEKWYRIAGELGNGEAWYQIGFMNEICSYSCNDDEIEEFQKLAFEAYQKSAELGNAKGQCSLGNCYKSGAPVKDEKKAVAWFRKAAEQNNKEGQLELGKCYRDGIGVSIDKSVAFYWFKKSAELDNADAQRCTALCYFDGDGVSADSKEAAKWLKRSAEKGNAYSCLDLGDCYRNGDGVEENEILAMTWYKKAIELGELDGNYEIKEQAEETIEAIKRDNATAQAFDYYESGNYQVAVSSFKAAANSGDSVAMFMLGLCYERGNGVGQNYYEAVNWYRKAADNGDALALEFLGDCYSEGNGVAQNDREAVRLYRKASESGNVDAKAKLGVCYISGIGISENFDYGVQLIEEAAEEGSEYAISFIEAYNEGYDEGYNEEYGNNNSLNFGTKAMNFLKSDQGKEILKKTALGAAKGAAKRLANGGGLASVIGGAVTGAAGSAITIFSDDDE